MIISQKIPSQFNAVPPFISTVIHALEQEFSLTEEEVFDIKLVLEEALTNAIKHGNRLHSDLTVGVSVVTQGNSLLIDVKDQGKGFDANAVPDPTSQDKLMKTSGRGVFLIKKLMDDVSFYDEGRGIRMVKTLGKPE